MPTGLTDSQVANIALEQIASQSRISSLNDPGSPAVYINAIYAPTVQLMLREIEPSFARFTGTLALSGAATPVPPWAYEYLWPDDCVRLLQVRPPSGSYNILDPQPIRSNVGFDTISAVKTKVILTNQVNAQAVYISSTVSEAQWDAAFTDAVVRRLASPLAMALSGRPDFAREILQESAAMAATTDAVDENMIARAS